MSYKHIMEKFCSGNSGVSFDQNFLKLAGIEDRHQFRMISSYSSFSEENFPLDVQ